MYLKSIKSHGFKSFADVIELDIKKGITGVVGPNGSGKSNIVDAVRWVLGEQSLKALRGTNNMSDIIFAGSKSRKPMNRAFVALTFDNSDHYLNTEFDTIEIKRVLYSSGDNEYFINNSKVRLKDITDLFIDSGAGKESFNIISQGSVADIINSKPEDRRVIFESAAGVLKYKKRKEETNRKLLRSQDNLDKINLIINELVDNRNALETQAADAKVYLENKKALEDIEIALIAEEIKNYNDEYTKLKELSEKLNTELNANLTANTESSTKLEELKLESIKLDESITQLNEQIITISSEIADLNSEKQLTIERKKYEVDSNLLESNILNLKEEELTISKNIEGLKKDLELLNADLETAEKQYQLLITNLEASNLEKAKYDNVINSKEKENLILANQIEILEENIAQDLKLPSAVRAVLNNPRLKGIHNIIGKLIDVDEQYALAIDTALGYSANIVVVEDENVAKDAINYLKTNKLGRATFFPLNIIKPKVIDSDSISRLSGIEGFIGIAANLVRYDSKYKNIIENQLGNVVVVNNIDTLNKVGKLLNYRYRVVSLTADILHTGGAMSGGAVKQSSNSTIMQKEKLRQLKDEKEKVESFIRVNQDNITLVNAKISEESNALNETKTTISDIKEKINLKNISLSDYNKLYDIKHNELVGSQDVKDNRLDEELERILNNYYKKITIKENYEKDLKKLKNEKNEIFLTINDLEKDNRQKNSYFNQKSQELNKCEVRIGKLDVTLDNLLNTLSETYNMTYEKAFENYKLEIDISDAKKQTSKLKQIINSLGNVNTGAIEEFERVNTRYMFLNSQKQDLEESINSLNKVIDEMDKIMKEHFLATFSTIEAEFNKVYKKLFKGGEGHLKLTDPDNLLETGIDIIAQPPGKKLNSIGLLSGGEKTLTAIALLFAILNVKTVPFVILDEVEAALDEANVETFGKYLLEKKDKSQFIIITHKKKTMEYADVLYGITMQESGISKLVSVKLENL